MENYKDISKIQDKMLDISNRLSCLNCMTKSLTKMLFYEFSSDEVIYMADTIYEKVKQLRKEYIEVEHELNI